MRARTALLCLGLVAPLAADTGPSVSITLVPAGVVRWRAEGKILPQGYTNRTEAQDAPLYILQWTQAPADRGYWGLSLWHTGVFGGGEFARESLPDVRPGTGGLYQRNLLNVGFTNFFATRYHPVGNGPLTAELGVSVVREIFKRKDFEVLAGTAGPLISAGELDDVNEISAEGLGFGLSGLHGNKTYFRWRGAAHYYVQFFDAKTDASAGQIFQAEAGLGWRPSPGAAFEIGGLHQWWFTLGQGNRRLSVPGTDGAVITYNRQNTVYNGFFVRAIVFFEARP